MPHFQKEVLTKYIGSGCKRQLSLYLTPDTKPYTKERADRGMPPTQPPRPGLELVVQAGDRWGWLKVADLAACFGAAAVIGDSRPPARPEEPTPYVPMALADALIRATPGTFLVETNHEVGISFQRAMGVQAYGQDFRLTYAISRPDLVQVLAPRTFSSQVTADGGVRELPLDDDRQQLRVIDVKLTSDPSSPYFAEVAYYTLTLAGWLEDEGLADRYVVVPDAAIWPGSYEESQLRKAAGPGTATEGELLAALGQDLKTIPFEAVILRLRRFFRVELREALEVPWQDHPYHVDNRCRGCEYLGYPWRRGDGKPTWDTLHCMPMAAERDHLSRVAFLGRSASSVLQEQGVSEVGALAQRLASDRVFDQHQELRASRTVVPGRAAALQTGQVGIPPSTGSSAVMPRWADLHVYMSADFDIGSAITMAFGVDAFWLQPFSPGGTAAARSQRRWNQVFVVMAGTPEAEWNELKPFLEYLRNIFDEALALDGETTVQVYVWDQLTQDHLTRVIGRHLARILADPVLAGLAWLFPPEEIHPNPAYGTRRSPITRVRDVVRALVAAPIPHYYSLLETARAYHPENTPENIAAYWVSALFEDALSDQVPSERAHEIWGRVTGRRFWQEQMQMLRRTVETRLRALAAVTRRLEIDLRGALGQVAPKLSALRSPRLQGGMSVHGELWYAFAKLNDALQELEVHQARAMPPHEREARFVSARLPRRLSGEEERSALQVLGLKWVPGRRVYELGEGSTEFKKREPDFDLALAPESMTGLLDRKFAHVVEGTWLEPPVTDQHLRWQALMEDVLAVTIVSIDRDRRMIALDPTSRYWTRSPDGRSLSMLDALEAIGAFDLSTDAILDLTHHDFLTPRLLRTLKAIGRPAVADADQRVQRALNIPEPKRRLRPSRHTPAADVLWRAAAVAEIPVAREIATLRTQLEAGGVTLNDSQWRAWEASLSRRLTLVWGPPGTGKSHTLRAVLLGALLEAVASDRPLRVLLCASNYTAIDNVLVEIIPDLGRLVPTVLDGGVARVRSYLARRNPQVPDAIDFPINAWDASDEILELRRALDERERSMLVASTPQQVHNLLRLNDRPVQGELFDLILIDEASQMDVANAVLALASLAEDGVTVLAGDHLQLPPIHPAKAPLGLETLVGSVYDYCRGHQGVEPVMLETSYRANETLISFARQAGYGVGLTSHSPNLTLNLLDTPPVERPADWPDGLFWTSNWATLLDPSEPAVCYVYPDGRSGVSNPFEAEAVAALALLLAGLLADQPRGERHPETGQERPAGTAPYDDIGLWTRGIGVVTPHRAQQGLVIARLRQAFPLVDGALLRGAVDTVERYQGQQRDVMIASFALGDPDAIRQEEEFLFSLRRFNVLASRARAKVIVLLSQEVVDHLSGDAEILRDSRLLKSYADTFCDRLRPLSLGFLHEGETRAVHGVLRTAGR